MTVETGSHSRQADEVDYWTWTDDDEAKAAAAPADEHPHVVAVSRIKEGTRKRLYEHGEMELDREMDKMYKCNYWDDPACARRLELWGLSLARAEAVLCFSDRVLRASEATLALRLRQQEWESHRSRDAADESDLPRAADAGEGRLFCFWRSVVDNLAALLRYFLG